MNVWLIQIGEVLPLNIGVRELRTAMLADQLIKRGHSVLWWASAFDHFKKDWLFKKDTELELKKNIKIIALKGIGYKKNISFSRYIDHKIIARKFLNIAPKMPKPDVIITAMPSYDLAYEAVMFAAKNGVPVFVDIRDPWPDIFLNHVSSGLQKLLKMALRKDFLMTKEVMKLADGLISMMNPLLEWGLRYAEREKTWKDKVFYLGCKRKRPANNKSAKNRKLTYDLDSKFVVTFIGTFAAYHNPSILVDCAAKLTENNIYFVLAGDGEFFKEIKRKASHLPNIVFPGWLNQEEIKTLLQNSHLGVCPTPHTAEFFPNKAFTYLSAGLPVISAFQGDLKEIIERYQIGFYYPPNDVDTLVDHIKRLDEDRNLYAKMSENAARVFNDKFDADKIYEEYVEHIEMIARHNYK